MNRHRSGAVPVMLLSWEDNRFQTMPELLLSRVFQTTRLLLTASATALDVRNSAAGSLFIAAIKRLPSKVARNANFTSGATF